MIKKEVSLEQLKGTSQEISQQLLELAKKRVLTAEEIKALAPITKDVATSFVDGVKEIVKGTDKMSSDTIHFFEKQVDIYGKLVENDSLTEEQKDSVIDQMASISKMIHDFSNRSIIGWQTVVSFIFSVLGCIVILLLLLAGKIMEKPSGKVMDNSSLSPEQMKQLDQLLAAAPQDEN